MKKLILFLAALCCTTVMQAEIAYNVPYIDENGVERICDQATVVPTLNGTIYWTEGWYLVANERIGTCRIECAGAVHLILGDGALLEQLPVYDGLHNPGIKVSGGSSLTIYGQKNQTGLLIARGDEYAAGIGGGNNYNGNNITINGGRVEAYGGQAAAGIGGGMCGTGSNITINGGAVLAMAPSNTASAIGSGGAITDGAVSSNIFVSDRAKVMVTSSKDISITSSL